MKTAASVLILLAACTAPLPPEQQAEEDYQRALGTRDNAKALDLMNRAVQLDPRRADFYLERAMLHQALQDPVAALADFTAALATRDGDPFTEAQRATIYVGRATLYAQSGRVAEAEADLGEALRRVPDYLEAYLHRAQLRRKSGRPAAAEKDVAEARRLAGFAGTHADGFYNEGVRALNQGHPGEAERLFGFALDLDPDHARTRVAMARLHLSQERFAEAVKEFDIAIRVQPENALLHYHRGTAQLAAGRPEEALADFERATALDPREAAYRAARGQAWRHARRDLEKARADFDAAIEMDRNCETAWFNRGLLRQEQKDLEGAEQDLRRAVAIHASPEGTLALGRVLHDREQFDAAIDLYLRALNLYGDARIRKIFQEELERSRKAKESK